MHLQESLLTVEYLEDDEVGAEEAAEDLAVGRIFFLELDVEGFHGRPLDDSKFLALVVHYR